MILDVDEAYLLPERVNLILNPKSKQAIKLIKRWKEKFPDYLLDLTKGERRQWVMIYDNQWCIIGKYQRTRLIKRLSESIRLLQSEESEELCD